MATGIDSNFVALGRSAWILPFDFEIESMGPTRQRGQKFQFFAVFGRVLRLIAVESLEIIGNGGY